MSTALVSEVRKSSSSPVRDRRRTRGPAVGPAVCAPSTGPPSTRRIPVPIAAHLDGIHRLPGEHRPGPPSPHGDSFGSDIEHLGPSGGSDRVGAPPPTSAPDSGDRSGPVATKVVERAEVPPPHPVRNRGDHLAGTVQHRCPMIEVGLHPSGPRPDDERATELSESRSWIVTRHRRRSTGATSIRDRSRPHRTPGRGGSNTTRHSVSVTCRRPPVAGTGLAGRLARKPTSG